MGSGDQGVCKGDVSGRLGASYKNPIDSDPPSARLLYLLLHLPAAFCLDKSYLWGVCLYVLFLTFLFLFLSLRVTQVSHSRPERASHDPARRGCRQGARVDHGLWPEAPAVHCAVPQPVPARLLLL